MTALDEGRVTADTGRGQRRGDMARTYQVISGDGHLESPPTPGSAIFPRSTGPGAAAGDLADGGEAWIVEGMP